MWELTQRVILAVLTIVILLCLVWGWKQLQQPTTYPIRYVRFVGTYHYIKPIELETAALPYVQTGFFALNSRDLQKHIQQIPWVDSAEVIRRWPHTIEIRFSEQQPAARWQETAVINIKGEIFEPESESIPKALPSLYGDINHAQSILEEYQAMQDIAQKSTLRIKEAHVSPSGSWTIMLNDDIVVKLGRKDQQRRLRFFVSSYPGVFKSKRLGVESVDLRYSSGMAVKWRRQQNKNLEKARSTHLNVKKTG